MKIIFCANPFHLRQPDEMYQAEVEAAKLAGFDIALCNFEALVNESNVTKAIRQIPTENTSQMGIYRGWMLKPNQYELLYKALADKGITLINDPASYRPLSLFAGIIRSDRSQDAQIGMATHGRLFSGSGHGTLATLWSKVGYRQRFCEVTKALLVGSLFYSFCRQSHSRGFGCTAVY